MHVVIDYYRLHFPLGTHTQNWVNLDCQITYIHKDIATPAIRHRMLWKIARKRRRKICILRRRQRCSTPTLPECLSFGKVCPEKYTATVTVTNSRLMRNTYIYIDIWRHFEHFVIALSKCVRRFLWIWNWRPQRLELPRQHLIISYIKHWYCCCCCFSLLFVMHNKLTHTELISFTTHHAHKLHLLDRILK